MTQLSHYSGLAAETSVVQHYQNAGACDIARRWRGSGGEIDLIVEHGGTTVFVEVKKSKTHATAALRLRPAQVERILSTAYEFLAAHGLSQDAEMRFDVALVDAQGRVEICENALMA
ncbi:MAG: YraN family protein [Pseudomonadota bacterium]